jgi:hypothetical protein
MSKGTGALQLLLDVLGVRRCCPGTFGVDVARLPFATWGGSAPSFGLVLGAGLTLGGRRDLSLQCSVELDETP